MRSFRGRLPVAPLGWLFVLYWAWMAAASLLLTRPFLESIELPLMVRRLIFALVTALGLTCASAWERRRVRVAMGGATREEWRSAVLTFHRGMRTGEPDADLTLDHAVLALIECRKRENGRSRCLALQMIGAFILLLAIAARDSVFAVLAVLWIGFFGVDYLRESRVRRPRIARLEEALRARSADVPDNGAVAP